MGLSPYDHVNAQVALDAYVAEPGISCEMLGLSLEHGFRPGLAELAQRGASFEDLLAPGPIEYVGVDVGDRVVMCVKAGVALLREGDDALAVLIAPGAPPGMDDDESGSRLEVMARARVTAERWLARIRELMDRHNVYRGKVVALGSSHPFRPADRTVVLLTGQALGAVGPGLPLAQSLQPSMVVLEDVDLVAMKRSHFRATPVLFELLNAMDGLDQDADLIFALTTNRPD